MKKKSSQHEAGFTRIDLVAVIAIIGVLALIGTQKLAAAGPSSASVTCIGNMQQLIRALHLYATDNGDFLPPNNDSANAPNWLLHNGILAPDATNSAKLISSSSMLAPYLNGNAGVFRCPADSSTVSVGGKLVPRVRSISLSQAIGTDPYLAGGKRACNGPWLDGAHGHLANTTFRTYGRLADIVNPRPASLFAFLDEHPDSMNDEGFACMGPTPSGADYRWINWPATFHDKAGGFGFMDGHGEIHSWVNSGTLVSPPQNGAAQQDLHWLATHVSALVADQP